VNKKKKRADALLLGDKIVEGRRTYPVTGVMIAACSPYKTHVEIDQSQRWCYDSGDEVYIA
jgi:hypothetical protein